MKYGALKRLELFSALASPSQEKGLLHDYTKGCELKHNVNSSATCGTDKPPCPAASMRSSNRAAAHWA